MRGTAVFAAITTFAPSRAARRPIALPIPRLAPVMKSVLPRSVRMRASYSSTLRRVLDSTCHSLLERSTRAYQAARRRSSRKMSRNASAKAWTKAWAESCEPVRFLRDRISTPCPFADRPLRPLSMVNIMNSPRTNEILHGHRSGHFCLNRAVFSCSEFRSEIFLLASFASFSSFRPQASRVFPFTPTLPPKWPMSQSECPRPRAPDALRGEESEWQVADAPVRRAAGGSPPNAKEERPQARDDV